MLISKAVVGVRSFRRVFSVVAIVKLGMKVIDINLPFSEVFSLLSTQRKVKITTILNTVPSAKEVEPKEIRWLEDS
ncbi:hypothetical protein N7449_001610 [Penicillium cf. viridicatum]|uniref:Uncharacterized protein n=1 Tax=Penicillium cf. viridicatum TaxID=2972119 RepID=A0A9W9N750_9EURO|nr:hypothetical protein N7449_001610 [Penicillium cf. viridicatum]